MELDQVSKRLDWLDEELRKNKHSLNALEERLASTDTNYKSLRKQVKDLSGEISRLTTAAARVDQFDEIVAKNRAEINRFIEDLEKQREESQLEQDKKYQVEFTNIDKTLTGLRKLKDFIAALESDMKARMDEEARLSRAVTELKSFIETATRSNEEVKHAQNLIEDNRRQDAKRLTDLQGDIDVVRKRIESVREKSDLSNDSIRRIETRLTELLASEAERRQAQTAFIEKQSQAQVEHEHTWKEWEERFSALPEQTENINAQLQELDAAQRAIKHAREAYEEMTQKFERRINEISEMQRLSEDRFRQEWVTFKSDNQKNWAGYTLAQEETRRETNQSMEKLIERVTTLEDLTQTQQDILHQTKDAYEQYFHSLLAQIHELLTTYDRILGSPK